MSRRLSRRLSIDPASRISKGNDLEILKTPLPNQTDDKVNAKAIEYLEEMLVPYSKKHRDRLDGPRNLGKSLQLQENFFAYVFLSQLKRKVVFEEGGDSDQDPDENE